jgi:hypothetical protein
MKLRPLFLLAVLTWIAGCKTETNAPGIGDDYTGSGTPGACADRDGDGYGVGCPLGNECDDGNASGTNQCYVCQHDEPGCPCASEGARASCGLVTARIGNQTTCGYGASICKAGKWGACTLDGKTTQSFTPSRAALGLAPLTVCSANPCDPYCRQFADTPDNTLSEGNLVGTDAGLTVGYVDGGGPPLLPNGPMPDRIKTALTDAGLYPDAQPDAIVYHELAPPTTAQDTVTTAAQIKAIDLYFLEPTSGGVRDETTAIQTAATGAGGIVDQVRTTVPDTWFGAGHFEQYDQWPWNDVGVATAVYEHVFSMTNDTTALGAGLTWITDHVISGPARPDSWIEALFATSTTGGLRRGAKAPWVAARAAWASRFNGESGPCPAGRVGYPCFRPDALPITVLLANSPANNGPGGQYAYSRDAVHGVDGATLWGGAATTVTGNGTEATAYTIDPTQFATYTGNTSTSSVADQSWTFTPFGDPSGARPSGCDASWFGASPNVFFKFTVTQRTWFHFDTVGSTYTQHASGDPDYGTALYLYQRSAGGTTAGVACNYAHFFDDPTKPNVSSIDGFVDPGDYFLVVDGIYGSRGNYVLHVNAMPDGIATSAPNYDEALRSYEAIGAKIVGVDASGFACDSGYSDFVQRNTGNALAKLALDTRSVDGAGNPYVVYLNQFGGRCHSGDPPIATQIASAILGSANARMNVSAVAVDHDDAIDFDGQGGATTLTPNNIDDASFVQSITTVATADTTTNCLQTLPDRFVGCRPGTKATFTVTFKTPAAVPMLFHEQIFTFVIRTLRDGASVLSETPVVIVVPSIGLFYYADAWFMRDYDTTDACPRGTAPLWGFFTWNANTPGDSHIDLDVAATLAQLSSAPVDTLVFSDPPGPSSVVGQQVGVQTRAGGPDTETGGTLVDSTLALNMRSRDSAVMRLRAHLVPSVDGTFPPLLKLWNQQISCQPAE